MSKYAAARNREIQDHLAVVKNRRLDFLFLSHAHKDHMAGIPELLKPGTGLQVDTFVLPLMTTLERLVALASSAPGVTQRFLSAVRDRPYRGTCGL